METPIGGFLDSFPSGVYIACHVIFLVIGLWAARKASAAKLLYAPAFWLYVVTQIIFLTMFGGLITMKMAVLLEQTCIVIMVIWIASKAKSPA